MSRVELKFEAWRTVWPEASWLFARHHEEVGASALGPLQVAEELAEALDEAGVLKIASARDMTGALVGYCMWYLGPNLESKNQMVATQGPWYSSIPGVGLRLFDFSIKLLPSFGVTLALPHHWNTPSGVRIGGLLMKKYGAKPLEFIYAIDLREREKEAS